MLRLDSYTSIRHILDDARKLDPEVLNVPIGRYGFAADALTDIRKMHQMYSLPVSGIPTPLNLRHEEFKRILQKEISEGADIDAQINHMHDQFREVTNSPEQCTDLTALELEESILDVLVSYADWLVDIMVYCQSEALRLGLDVNLIQNVIMQSNFTKLGADGLPIKDEDGKVCKGPNFLKPEPTLRALIRHARTSAMIEGEYAQQAAKKGDGNV